MVDWAFVFVDDFCTLAPSLNHGSTLHLCPSGNLLALGTPVSWKKTLLGPINTWLGLVIQPAGPIVQMDKENTTQHRCHWPDALNVPQLLQFAPFLESL